MRKYLGLLALAVSAAVFAQSGGAQLLQNFAKTLFDAKSLKASFTAGSVTGAQSGYEVAFAKPNMARIETPSELIVADGKTVTVFDKTSNTYYKDPQTAGALASCLRGDAIGLWTPFFDANALSKAAIKSLGTKTRKGVQYQAIEATFGGGMKKVTYYIGADGLARQAEIAYSDTPEQTIVLTKTVELGAGGDAALYAFTPPSGAKELTAEERNSGKWFESLDEGLAEARKTGKLVMMDFSAVW